MSDFKSLVDALAAFHDPANGRLVVGLNWVVDLDQVHVSIVIEGVADTDLDTEIAAVTTALSNAPNTWPTGDDAFQWG